MSNTSCISLVTGAGGFVGANLVRKLVSQGERVHVFLRDGKPNWRLTDIADKIVFHKIDLIDARGTHAEVDSIKPEVVYHFATYGGYPKQQSIEQSIQTNVIGSTNLMQSCLELKNLKRFINIGSSSEYGAKDEPMRESDILEPSTPYGITKAAQTLFAQYFAEKKNIPIVTLRLLAVYGQYEEPGRLITDIMLAHVLRKPLKLLSSTNVRDFVFVEDVVEACLKATEVDLAVSEIFNIGGGREYTVGETVTLATKIAGVEIPLELGSSSEARSFETQHWVADISKAERIFGWHPAHSLEDGLKKTYEWYRANIQLYEKNL